VSLILNNKGPAALPVDLTVHSLQGDRLELPPVVLPGQSAETLSLNGLLRIAGASFQEGSVELSYRYAGCALVLSAGLILEDAAAGIAFDELLVRPHHRVSRRLEGLWWVPSPASRLELVFNTPSFPATHPMTAQQPTRIRLLSGGSTDSASCSANRSGPRRMVTWQVLDRWGEPMLHPSMPVSDLGDLHVNPIGDGCLITEIATGSTLTGPGGEWPDSYSMCSGVCYSSPPCTTTATQVFTINGKRLSTDPIYVTYQCSAIAFPNKE
jgi:hypothetical protein